MTNTKNDLYAKAWSECHENLAQRNNGLWAKAYSEANGDENKAVAIYVQLRVCQLAGEQAATLRKQDKDVSPNAQHHNQKTISEQGRSTQPTILLVVFGVIAVLVVLVIANKLLWSRTSRATTSQRQDNDNQQAIVTDTSANDNILFIWEKNGKYGFVDKTGRIVIQAKYDDAHYFNEGLADVKLGSKWGFIDKSGNNVIKATFDETGQFCEGFASVRVGNKWGFIDKSGNYLIKPEYNDVPYGGFCEGIAVVSGASGTYENYHKQGYVNTSGKLVVSPQFDVADNFSEGLAWVMTMKYREKDDPLYRSSGEQTFGYIDKKGKYILHPQYTHCGRFKDGIAPVRTSSIDSNGYRKFGTGFIDREGSFVIQPQFLAAKEFSEGLAAVKVKASIVGTTGKWGYIDKSGTIMIEPQFEEAYEFSDGLASIQVGKKLGFIDRTGKCVINPQFLSHGYGSYFHDGIAAVSVSKERGEGIIDKSGSYLIKPEYDKIEYLGDGYFIIKSNGVVNYTDKTGKLVIQW